MSSSRSIWSSSSKKSTSSAKKRDTLVQEKRGNSNNYFRWPIIPFFTTVKDAEPRTPQLPIATPSIVKKTTSKFEYAQSLAEIGYLPQDWNEDTFRMRIVHTKVAAFNSMQEQLDRSCRELYPKTPAHLQEEFISRLEEQKKLEDKERLEDKPRWPYVDSDDCSRMDVDDPGEDLGVVVLVSVLERQKILIAARKAPLSQEEMGRVRLVLNGPSTQEVLIEKYAIDMTRAKILCLRPCTWLNDEVINYYMNMLMERDQLRSDQSNGQVRSSHFFSSFFMVKLLQNGKYTYPNVKRWSKKFDVFAKDKIFIPVNISNSHWTLLVVYVQRKEIHYYDSMSGSGKIYTKAAMKWLEDESREKKQVELDSSSWRIFDCENGVPQQRNGFDCGMFTIMCADAVIDDLPLSVYGQDGMPENRLKVAAAILRGTLNY